MQISLGSIAKQSVLIMSLLLYILSIQYGALTYLPNQQSAPGIFQENAFDVVWFLLFVPLVVISSLVLPRSINKPSHLFFLIVYLIVYLPAISFLSLREAIGKFDGLLLAFSLTVAVLIVSLPMGFHGRGAQERDKRISKWLLWFSCIGLTLCMVFLTVKYHSVMNFSSPETLYQQRELGRADSWYIGYMQTYLAYFFSAIVFSIGVSEKKLSSTVLGLAGFVVLFLITAERSTLIFPVAIILIIRFLYLFRYAKALIICFLVFSSLIVLVVSSFYEYSRYIDLLGFYYFARIIAVPGQFVVDYFNFFSVEGYTYLSHVKGFNFFVPVPDAYVAEDRWPALGWIVGERWHGINSNSNASFFASDGIAAFGILGPLISSVLLSVYLFVLDAASKSIPKDIALASVFPLAFSLTNGSFFSAILSYGGFMFLVVFYLSGVKKINFLSARERSLG